MLAAIWQLVDLQATDLVVLLVAADVHILININLSLIHQLALDGLSRIIRAKEILFISHHKCRILIILFHFGGSFKLNHLLIIIEL